jgi:hypothetical protein
VHLPAILHFIQDISGKNSDPSCHPQFLIELMKIAQYFRAVLDVIIKGNIPEI